MISTTEFIYFIILELILFLYLNRTKDIKLKNILVIQNLICIITLLVTHYYAYHNYITFPDITFDGMKYDFYSHNISENIKAGVFKLSDMSIYSTIPVTGFIPYWTVTSIDAKTPIHIIVGGIIYFLFGYSPIIYKFWNVFLFSLSTILIYKMQIHYKAPTLYTKLFAFNPYFIIYSVTMAKETMIILLVLIIFYHIYVKGVSLIETGLALILLFIYRPYIAVIMLLFLWLKVTRARYRIYVLILTIIILLSIEYSMELFSFIPNINEMNFAIKTNEGFQEYYMGIVPLLRSVIRSPLRFFKYILYYFYNAIFEPIPWVFSFKYGGEGELAYTSSAISFESLSRWLYSFIHIYLIAGIVRRLDNIIKNKEYLLLIILAFITILFNAIRTGVERYQECITLPLLVIMLIMIPPDEKRNATNRMILLFCIYIFIFLSDLIIRERTIFNI